MSEVIKIKYHDPELVRVEKTEKGDFIDLRSAEDVYMAKGDFKIISLGISAELPKGYEMVIVPRSSTFKNFGIIQTNSPACIDESYCGNNDIIGYPAYALRDTFIHKNDRICQFRIQKHQPEIELVEVEHLDGNERGGFGSTGIQ